MSPDYPSQLPSVLLLTSKTSSPSSKPPSLRIRSAPTKSCRRDRLGAGFGVRLSVLSHHSITNQLNISGHPHDPVPLQAPYHWQGCFEGRHGGVDAPGVPGPDGRRQRERGDEVGGQMVELGVQKKETSVAQCCPRLGITRTPWCQRGECEDRRYARPVCLGRQAERTCTEKSLVRQIPLQGALVCEARDSSVRDVAQCWLPGIGRCRLKPMRYLHC